MVAVTHERRGGLGALVRSIVVAAGSAVLSALLLSLILNVLPLLQWPTAYGPIAIGGLTLLALVLYQGPALIARPRAAWDDSRHARSALAGAHPE